MALRKLLPACLPALILVLGGLAIAEEESEPTYQELVARAKKMDAEVDFTKLRMAYAQSPDYNPYDNDRKSRDAMRAAFRANEFQKAVKYADKLLDRNYADIEAHRYAGSAHVRLKNDERAKVHDFASDGLMQSILESGDGKSPSTALVVITTSEEYAVMNTLGVRPMKQSLVEDDGHAYDRQEGVDEENQPITLYFNIDRPFKWLANTIKSKE